MPNLLLSRIARSQDLYPSLLQKRAVFDVDSDVGGLDRDFGVSSAEGILGAAQHVEEQIRRSDLAQ